MAENSPGLFFVKHNVKMPGIRKPERDAYLQQNYQAAKLYGQKSDARTDSGSPRTVLSLCVLTNLLLFQAVSDV